MAWEGAREGEGRRKERGEIGIRNGGNGRGRGERKGRDWGRKKGENRGIGS